MCDVADFHSLGDHKLGKPLAIDEDDPLLDLLYVLNCALREAWVLNLPRLKPQAPVNHLLRSFNGCRVTLFQINGGMLVA
jgi:hypothetical protein